MSLLHGRFSRWLQRQGWAVVPLEALYRGAIVLRNRLYDLGILAQSESAIPVVSVGNLAVGGTGKTPVSSWLLDRLVSMGRRPALVTRGYGCDEVLLYELRNPGVPVVVQKSKLEGVAQAAREGADVAVLDDGFQHREAGRVVDIVLLAAEQRTQDRLLPRGMLREPWGALSRADAIVITRKVASQDQARELQCLARVEAPEAVIGQVHLHEEAWIELGPWTESAGKLPTSGVPEGDLLAVSSIAEPDAFHEMVRSGASGVVECMAFPDHHPFSRHDIHRIVERAGTRSIVTTEKDAVKLKTFSTLLPATYVLRLQVTWDFGQEDVMELIGRALDRRP